MPSTLLPLPLYLLVSRNIEHHVVGRDVIPCMDDAGRLVARVVCEPQNERRLLGFLPTQDAVKVSVFRSGDEGECLVAEGVFDTSLCGFHGPALRLRGTSDDLYEAVADGYEVDPRIRAEDGSTIGTVGLLHVLSNALEVRDPDGAPICVVRVLPRRRYQRLPFPRAPGRVVVGFDAERSTIDARLVVAWLYALSVRALTR